MLTVRPEVYDEIAEENYELIPLGVNVQRAWGRDARKHLSIRGRYLAILALPDRLQSWIVGGFLRGVRMLRQHRPRAIMSTYPIASAHCIGYLLARWSGLPWVVELRDPMVQDAYPKQALEKKAYAAIERRIFQRANLVVVTTEGCAELYARRFPKYPRENIVVVSNGYDPEMFPETIMPAFYIDSGYERPLDKFAGKSILSAQQVEDIVAYLLTLTE